MRSTEVSPDLGQYNFWAVLTFNTGLAQYLEATLAGRQPSLPPDEPSRVHFANFARRFQALPEPIKQTGIALVHEFCATDYTDDDHAAADFNLP